MIPSASDASQYPEGRHTPEATKFTIAGRTLTILIGDITLQNTDAIVNAANSSLMGGGGVDGAIHRAGGPVILAECRQYREKNPPLPAGRAIATIGGNLAARYVIHTVGPVWRGGDSDEAGILASCYRESLRVADELRLSSIAFPSVSTGAFGYPVDQAATIVIKTVVESLSGTQHIKGVRFVLFDERTWKAYNTAAEKIIPERAHS
jgi:O-acetyl-ADP-ribose deacetylase (regulator of RNase III)